MKNIHLATSIAIVCSFITTSIALATEHPVATPIGGTPPSRAFNSTHEVLMRGVGLDVFQDGADHIVGQQCPDGGFGWPHDDCTTTFNNITAPIMMGVLTAWEQTADPDHLASAVSGADFDLTSQYPNGEPRLGAFAAHFMAAMTDASGDPTYATFATDFFNQLAAGTYSDTDLDTEGWIALIESVRTGTWVNLRPWEFHLNVQTAADLGQPGQAESFIQGVLRGLNTLDNSDPDTVFSDILGVAGAVKGLALANRQVFPIVNAPLHDGVNGLSSLQELGNLLVSYQNPNGSWYWHSNLAAPAMEDEDAQTTAYAVLALEALDPVSPGSFAGSIEAGQNWLEGTQLANGGFPSSPGGAENTEVEGEVLWALGAGPAPSVLEIPTLGSWGMVALMVLIGLLAVRRLSERSPSY